MPHAVFVVGLTTEDSAANHVLIDVKGQQPVGSNAPRGSPCWEWAVRQHLRWSSPARVSWPPMRSRGWAGSTPTSDEEAIDRILNAVDEVVAEHGSVLRRADVAARSE